MPVKDTRDTQRLKSVEKSLWRQNTRKNGGNNISLEIHIGVDFRRRPLTDRVIRRLDLKQALHCSCYQVFAIRRSTCKPQQRGWSFQHGMAFACLNSWPRQDLSAYIDGCL